MTNETITYYDQNAADFIENTINADMSAARNLFLRYIKPGGRILDAGCGSGRDSLAFLEAGYQVDAFDASEEICRIASERLGFPVACRRFEDLEGEAEYDGIWCCASLLHVKAEDLPDVMQRLRKLLKPTGVVYVSFKKGNGERNKDGRYFHDMTVEACETMLQGSGFAVLESYESSDVRQNREDEVWINAIGIRCDQPLPICLTPFKELCQGRKSIYDYIDPEYEVPEKVVLYLKTTKPYLMSPGIYSHPFKPEEKLLGPYLYTDGHYSWDRDTWKYVVKYGLKLPQDFIDHVMTDEGTEFIKEQMKSNDSWSSTIQGWEEKDGFRSFLPKDTDDNDISEF